MAGVWEALFYEEKQDWITTIVGGVSCVLTLALELPCTLLALTSTFLLMSWDYTCQGAQQVSDLLGLQEWWTLEHSLWLLIILMEVPVLRRRSKGFGNLFLLQSLEILNCIFVWGSLLFLLNGLQGGVVFGGKLFHPTVFTVAFICYAFSTSLKTFVKEIGGYEHDGEIKDQKTKNFLTVVIKSVDLEAMILGFVAMFGMPQFDLNGDPKTWLVAAPLLVYATSYNEMLDMVAPPEEKTADANGEATQVTEEKPAEEKPAEEKPTEEKPAEEKKDEEKPAEEKKAPNPVSQALDALCGLVCKMVGLVTCCLNQTLCLINTVKDKVMSLPWPCIISLATTLGIETGICLGGWILTEDYLVFAHPVCTIFGKFVLDKLQEKNVFEAKGHHLANELLDTVQYGIKYYLYRTYIQMPI